MNAKRLLILVYITLLPSLVDAAYMSGFPPGFNIRNLVKHTDLIVYGTVEDMEFVFRANTPSQYTTDITVEVKQVIKGTPNVDEDTVKFMIYGGTGIHPHTGKDLTVGSGHSYDFKIGKDVLLYLRQSKRVEMDTPYDGYYVFYGRVGKRDVKRNKVAIPYTFKKYIVDNYDGNLAGKQIDIRKYIELPIDLVIDISKASLVNYDAVVPLEEKIRDVIASSPGRKHRTISKSLAKELSDDANRIKERN